MRQDYFGRDARFHHIGVAVKSVIDICPDCRITHDPIQGVNVAFMVMNGCPLELIEPVREDSPVSACLRKGTKLLHVCYEVDDIEIAVRKSRYYGFHVIGDPAPAAAFEQRRIAFVSSDAFGVVELLEREKKV